VLATFRNPGIRHLLSRSPGTVRRSCRCASP
jgi:hypothetical protein